MSTHKICCSCKMVVPKEDFSRDKTRVDGLVSMCKICKQKSQRDWYHNRGGAELQRMQSRDPIGSELSRSRMLQSKYGLTLEEYDQMFEIQNGGCEICGGLNKSGRRLAVDHNHNTGEIRGLLCNRCNGQLAALENKTFKIAAEEYLKKYMT